MSRTAGLRGRRPAKRLDGLKFAHEYADQPLPAPAYPVDVSGGITAWGMLGNGPDPTCTTNPDGVGDCTFAGREHAKRAKATAGQEVEQWETSDSLVAEYLAYDGGQDVGANIADLLLYWYRNGTILAFAPVDHTDPAAVDSAMQAFHGVYVGVNLTDDADQLFEEGQPWGSGSLTPDPSSGHCIVKVASDAPGTHLTAEGALDTWVTWGALQKSTKDWTSACLDEAYVIITQEDADAASLDVAALRADIEALGGTGGSNGMSLPPVNLPGLLDEIARLAREVEAGGEHDIHDLINFLRSHGL